MKFPSVYLLGVLTAWLNGVWVLFRTYFRCKFFFFFVAYFSLQKKEPVFADVSMFQYAVFEDKHKKQKWQSKYFERSRNTEYLVPDNDNVFINVHSPVSMVTCSPNHATRLLITEYA